MAVNSKNKGNTFERKIANTLSERFEEHTELESAFRRASDSGSFFGKTNESRIHTHGLENAQFGDIITPSDFKFTIECKHYKDPPSFNAIIKQDWKQLDEWIEQAERDGTNAKKDWMIIIKYNRIDEFVVLSESHEVDAIVRYKGKPIVSLATLLAIDTGFFFD